MIERSNPHPKYRTIARILILLGIALHQIHIFSLIYATVLMVISSLVTLFSAYHDHDLTRAVPHRPTPTLVRLIGKCVFIVLYYLIYSVHPTLAEIIHWIIIAGVMIAFGVVIGYGLNKVPSWKKKK